jgi:F-type H+-transporting ATPase subunit delta
MDEIARVYAEALFESAKKAGNLDVIKEQLDQFADAMTNDRELQLFFFSPYFSSAEKREGLEKAVDGAEAELINFLGLLAEKHRMPAIFRIRARFDDLWAVENKRLEVTVTSAVDLDPELVQRIGSEIESQTGQTVDLQSNVDPDILGGLVLRVGNKVLDASVRNRLDKLRKNVASAAA